MALYGFDGTGDRWNPGTRWKLGVTNCKQNRPDAQTKQFSNHINCK